MGMEWIWFEFQSFDSTVQENQYLIQHYTYAQFRIYVTESLEPFERILQTGWLVLGGRNGRTYEPVHFIFPRSDNLQFHYL